MTIFFTVIAFIYGTVFGSFFNVVAYRVPAGTMFKEERSYCDNCGHTLTWKELIPVVSYVAQGGKCANCEKHISPIHPIIELLTGLLFAFTFYGYGWSHELLLGLLLIAMVIITSVSDIAYYKIPNQVLLFFSVAFIIYRIFYPLTPWWGSLLGLVVAFILIFLIILLSKGGMGMGDLKYYLVLAFLFGTGRFLLLFFLSTVYGLAFGLIKMTRSKTGRQTKIAFGPFIGMAALTVFFFGDTMIEWYLQLFM